MNIYDILKFFEEVDSDRTTFNFENDKKEIISLELKAIENKKINYISKNKKNMKTNEVPSGENEVYWYKNFEEDEILYFRLNKFTTNFHIFKGKIPLNISLQYPFGAFQVPLLGDDKKFHTKDLFHLPQVCLD